MLRRIHDHERHSASLNFIIQCIISSLLLDLIRKDERHANKFWTYHVFTLGEFGKIWYATMRRESFYSWKSEVKRHSLKTLSNYAFIYVRLYGPNDCTGTSTPMAYTSSNSKSCIFMNFFVGFFSHWNKAFFLKFSSTWEIAIQAFYLP